MHVRWPWSRSRLRPRRRKPVLLRLPFTIQIFAWLILGVTVASAASWTLWLLLGFPTLATSNPAPLTADNKFDVVKIALTVVGGIGGVIALTVAYRKQRLGEAAEYREDTKLFNERFMKASELLGSDQSAVRLSGVYTIAALADDWHEGRQSCIDVLCAYHRKPYTPPASNAATGRHRGTGISLRKPRPGSKRSLDPKVESRTSNVASREEQQVRHAIIRVIANHLKPDVQQSWQGCIFDFTEATLDGGDFSDIHLERGELNFTGATFVGQVKFNQTTFSGGATIFTAATFKDGLIDFSYSTMSAGVITFGAADFSGGTIDFTWLYITGGHLDFSYATFNLDTVDIRNLRLKSGIVSFESAEFKGAFTAMSFYGGALSFRNTELDNGTFDFTKAELLGGTVDFSSTTFGQSTVNLKEAAIYDVPPRFATHPGKLPANLVLSALQVAKTPTNKGLTAQATAEEEHEGDTSTPESSPKLND